MAWKKLWAWGEYGCRVAVMKRHDSPNLYLRYGDKWRSLDHSDMPAAKAEAKKQSAALAAGRRGGSLKLGHLFRLYQADVTPTKSEPQQREDARRIAMWKHALGEDFDPLKLTGSQLKAFQRARMAGTIKVPGRKLRKVGAESVRHDLAFLKAVFSWAAGMDSGWLMERNPMDGYKLPVEVNPSRPRAYWEDFQAVMRVAANKNALFPHFMTLVESLGWRVSAICQIRASDFDPVRTKGRPHGRLLKRAETDKVGVQRWTILPKDARRALEALVRTGKKVGERYLFKAEKSKGAWSRFYARDLLNKAYEDAKVPEERRVGFHAYRRKWVDERKHLPQADVAAQGGWLSTRTLDIYEAPDEETLRAVAEEPRKLRHGRDS